MSIETAARELRYRFLADAVQQAGAQGVATGHTLDDQAETVLMNVIRGTGTRGLAGMRRRFERAAGPDWPAVTVLRPLLDLRHSDCEEACRASGLQWLEDPSNRDMSFMRNRVRHELLPLAEKIRPGTTDALSRLAENAREANTVLRELAATGAPVVGGDAAATVNRFALRSMHPTLQTYAMAALYETAAGGLEGLEQDHLVAMRELAAGDSGTELALPGGMVFRVDYETCAVSRREQEADTDRPSSVPSIALEVPGEAELPGKFKLKVTFVAPPRDPAEFGPNVAHVSAAAVSGPLRVRARNDGDRFHPLGMKSEIRLQDFFVNAHVPERFRDRVLLVESDRGIVWVSGYRIAEWAKLDESSERAIRLELSGPESPSTKH
jgi:tRNA(Ile)-lysidine synthase